jgi:hypothetical protein
MNPRIQKVIDEIKRTKAKIAELQALLPELERKKTDLENTEIVRLVRSANVAPGDIAAFVESIKTNRQGNIVPPKIQQEVSDNNEE